MPISNERLQDRVELLRALLEIKGAFDTLALKADLHTDPEILAASERLGTLVDTMLNRLEADQK